jgi:hypothetical protein
MACHVHYMLAPWNNLVHKHWAANSTIILILPTWKILGQMTALEYPVLFEDGDYALVWARIPTKLRTWV